MPNIFSLPYTLTNRQQQPAILSAANNPLANPLTLLHDHPYTNMKKYGIAAEFMLQKSECKSSCGHWSVSQQVHHVLRLGY